jgi:hypothetical protein
MHILFIVHFHCIYYIYLTIIIIIILFILFILIVSSILYLSPLCLVLLYFYCVIHLTHLLFIICYFIYYYYDYYYFIYYTYYTYFAIIDAHLYDRLPMVYLYKASNCNFYFQTFYHNIFHILLNAHMASISYMLIFIDILNIYYFLFCY